MPGLNIVVSANVQNANAGLQSVQHNLAATAAASNALGGSLANGVRGIDQAGQTVTNFGRILQDLPFGFVGIQNNLNPLLESFQRLRATTGTTGGALRALASSLTGGAGIGLALSAVTAAVTFASFGFGAWERIMGKSAKTSTDAADAAKKAKDAIHGIFEDVGKESANIQSLVVVLESETATRQRKNDALKELQKLQPEIFAGLKLEGETVIGLTGAYQKYIESLTTVIAARIKQQQLEQITTQILEKQGATLTGYSKVANDLGKILSANQKQQDKLNNKPAGETKTAFDKQQIDNAAQLKLLYKQQADLVKELGDLQEGIKVPDFKDPKPVKEKLDQVAETLRKLAIDRDELSRNPLLSFDEKDQRAFDLISTAINRLRDLKVATSSPIIVKLRADLDDLAAQIASDKFRERLKKTGISNVISIPVEISTELRKGSGLADIVKKNLAELDKLKLPRNLAAKVSQSIFDPEQFKESTERAKKYIENMAGFVQKTIDPIFSAVFDNIGKGAATTFQAIGEAIKGLVTQMIRAAAEAAVLSLILNAIFPGSGGQYSFAKIFAPLAGLPKFAEGGIVTQPTLGIFGEAGPEAVMPLNKLKDLIGSTRTSGTIDVNVTGSLSNRQINISNARGQRTFNRLYGTRRG